MDQKPKGQYAHFAGDKPRIVILLFAILTALSILITATGIANAQSTGEITNLSVAPGPQSNQVVLSWTAPTDVTPTGYEIFYRPVDSGPEDANTRVRRSGTTPSQTITIPCFRMTPIDTCTAPVPLPAALRHLSGDPRLGRPGTLYLTIGYNVKEHSTPKEAMLHAELTPGPTAAWAYDTYARKGYGISPGNQYLFGVRARYNGGKSHYHFIQTGHRSMTATPFQATIQGATATMTWSAPNTSVPVTSYGVRYAKFEAGSWGPYTTVSRTGTARSQSLNLDANRSYRLELQVEYALGNSGWVRHTHRHHP